jgi:hypothetical protein
VKSLIVTALALTLLMCDGCAARKKEPSCEEIHSRCGRLCEHTEEKDFHGPEHLPPPITKPGPSCREICTDELRSCETAREAASQETP